MPNRDTDRNLNSYQKSVLALQLEPLYAAEAKRKQIRKPESVRQNFDEQPPLRTDERLAQVAGDLWRFGTATWSTYRTALEAALLTSRAAS